MNKETLVNFYLKYKIIILPVLVSLSSVVLIIFLIYPQLRSFYEGQERLQKEKVRVFKLEAKTTDLASINETQVNQAVKSALVVLPQTQDFSSLIGIFQKLTVQSGVTLLSFQLGSSQIKVPGVSGFSVKMEVEGTGSNLALFLSNIDKASRLMKVESVEVSKSRSGILNGSILVDVFFAPVPKELGALDSEVPKLSAEDEKLVEELVKSIVVQETQPIATSSGKGKSNPFE